MDNQVDKALKTLLDNSLSELEKELNCDVLQYYGPIKGGNENVILDIIETLANDSNKKDTLAVVLTTNGGSAMVVERYVNIIRKHYQNVKFIIPDYAYSAGTIFAMSGDEIWMDYFSVLGPIDPQVPNKEGRFVPALGYLDKINDLINLARSNKISQAEFMILKDFDLAELRSYEQAKELTITLLKKWLVNYKFKQWNVHKDGNSVTMQEKEERAEEIAAKLGDNNLWKSHGRPINIEELSELKIKVNDFSNEPSRDKIRDYYKKVLDYVMSFHLEMFVHTRKFI